MRRCLPLQSLHHGVSHPLSSPPPPPLLHFRTGCHGISPSLNSSPSANPSRAHDSTSKFASHQNLSSRATPRCRWVYHSEATLSPRRKFSSTQSTSLIAKNSGSSGELGSVRGIGLDEEGDLDREWELEEGREHQGQQWQQKQQQRQSRPQQSQPSQQPQNSQKKQQQQPEQKQEPPKNNLNPTPISDAQYLLLSDHYMETLVSRLEEIQELREDLDFEYSVLSSPSHSALSHLSHPNPPIN